MKTSILLLALCAAFPTVAQTAPQSPSNETPPPGEVWSLNDCIGYAQQHNIDVQQLSLQVEKDNVSLSTSKLSRLPDLNASIGAQSSFGRVISSDNTYKNNNETSGSFGVSAGMPLFEGFRINREIKGGKLNLEAAVQDLERAREDVAVNVMSLYLKVLFNKELATVAEQQLALSTTQTIRSRELVAAGKQPESTYYESEAVRANDALTLTQARNTLQLSLLDLSQALNREQAAGFDIEVPTLDSIALSDLHRLGTAQGVYDYAVEYRPHIRVEKLRLAGAENAISTARSALYPSLSLSGGYSTGLYGGDNSSFGQQFRRNSREYIGVSMNIPIFNRQATRNNIRTAQLSLRGQQLTLTNAEQALRKQIEQAWYNADAAYGKYVASQAALASARVAFDYVEQKVAAGRATVFDFNDAKTRMEKAESNLVQSKYEFVFQSKILDYYRGKPLQL